MRIRSPVSVDHQSFRRGLLAFIGVCVAACSTARRMQELSARGARSDMSEDSGFIVRATNALRNSEVAPFFWVCFVPDWWAGDILEVRFRGRGFRAAEPGYWGAYEGTWVFTLAGREPTDSPRPFLALIQGVDSLKKLNRDDREVWHLRRPGRGISNLYAVHAGSRIVVSTDVDSAVAATTDPSLGIPPAEEHDVWIGCGLELAGRKKQRLEVTARWDELLKDGHYSIAGTGFGDAGDFERFICGYDPWSSEEQSHWLGASVEMRGTRSGLFRANIGVPDDPNSVSNVLWAWHGLVGFKMMT